MTGTESEFSRSSSKESKKTAKEKGVKEKGKGEEPEMSDNFKRGFKPDESSFLPEIKGGIDEYNISHPLDSTRFYSLCLHASDLGTTRRGRAKRKRRI